MLLKQLVQNFRDHFSLKAMRGTLIPALDLGVTDLQRAETHEGWTQTHHNGTSLLYDPAVVHRVPSNCIFRNDKRGRASGGNPQGPHGLTAEELTD